MKIVIALPVILLALWQFLACVLAIFLSQYSTIVVFSLLLSVIAAVMIWLTFPVHHLDLKLREGVGFTISASVATLLFIFCYRLGILDAFWPTTVINLVNQVIYGHFPVSYISYPEFWANYHQGFIFLSGQLARIAGLDAVQAIQILTCFFFFYFVILLQVATAVLSGPRWGYFSVILFLLIGSLQIKLPVYELYNANLALSVAEYFQSNSWPLSLCTLLVIVLTMPKSIDDYSMSRFVTQYVLLFSLVTANASLFAVGRLTFTVMLFMLAITQRKRVAKAKPLLTGLISLLLIWSLPRFIPSAFLDGDHYDSPRLALQLLGEHPEMIMPYYLYILRHIMLGGILAVAALCLIFWCLFTEKIKNARRNPLIIMLALMMGIAFTFPFIFSFTNINWWDNLHKFTIIWMVSALIFIAVYIPVFMQWARQSGQVAVCMGLIALLSVTRLPLFPLPSSADILQMFHFVRSSNDEPYAANDPAYADVVVFLKNQPHTALIYPYGQEFYHYSPALFIASFSGSYIRNCFYSNFLLSPKIKQSYADNMEWWRQDKLAAVMNDAYQNIWILMKNAQLPMFQTVIKDFNLSPEGRLRKITISDTMHFKEYSLLKLVWRSA